MHYAIVMHETDINARDMIRRFRQTPLKIDKVVMENNGLCSCVTKTFPVLRETRVFEVDVLDPAAPEFEKLLASMGFRSVRTGFVLNALIGRLLRLVGLKHGGRVEAVKLVGEGARMNSRSFVVARKPDDEHFKKGNFGQCARCGKKYPIDWA